MTDFHITRAMADAGYAYCVAEATARGYGQYVHSLPRAQAEQMLAEVFRAMWLAAPPDYRPVGDPPPGARP